MTDSGEIIHLPNGERRNMRPPMVTVHSASSFASKPVPLRSWIVRDVIPDRTVTLLSGECGVGKSLLALQLGVAMVSGKEWVGMRPTVGSVLYIGAEDEVDEVHRRLADVAAATGVGLTDLHDLHVISLAGEDAVLGQPDSRSGAIAMTPLWRLIEEKIADLRPRLLIIDNSADVFGGNEIARLQVRQFVAALRAAAIHFDMAVLLLSHPSVSGIANGSGTSGSTAWSNSVRSRLYFEEAKPTSGDKADPDGRMLRVMKANYGRKGAGFALRWEDGLFRLGGTRLEARHQKLIGHVDAEAVFMDLLRAFQAQEREVSPNPSRNYAPTVFAAHPDAKGVTSKGLYVAMERLLKGGTIRTEKSGPPSKLRSRIVAA